MLDAQFVYNCARSAQVVSYLEGLIASESSRTSRMVVNSSERCLIFILAFIMRIKRLEVLELYGEGGVTVCWDGQAESKMCYIFVAVQDRLREVKPCLLRTGILWELRLLPY